MGEEWEILLKMNDYCNNKFGIPERAYTITDKELEEMDLELSVIKADNDHGHESLGWGDEDKIILLDGRVYTQKQLNWWLNVA